MLDVSKTSISSLFFPLLDILLSAFSIIFPSLSVRLQASKPPLFIPTISGFLELFSNFRVAHSSRNCVKSPRDAIVTTVGIFIISRRILHGLDFLINSLNSFQIVSSGFVTSYSLIISLS